MKHKTRHHLLWCGIAAAIAGCEAPPTTPMAVPTAASEASTASASVEHNPPPLDWSIRSVLLEQEVLLHAALYRAAYEARSTSIASHVLLIPVDEDHPPDLATDPDAFRDRVLQQLSGLTTAVAWSPVTWHERAEDYFPGTQRVATRLSIRILRRDDEQATVFAEVSQSTPGESSMRQSVSAIWDGMAWNIEFAKARIVW